MPESTTIIVGIATAGLIALAALVVGIMALLRTRKPAVAEGSSPLQRMAAALQAGDDEAAAAELVEYLNATHNRMEQLQAEVVQLRERSAHPLQRLAMVHFDAADDISGRLSCALAALDANANGFLITTLYTRERSRAFVRRVAAGKTAHELLTEEALALQQALTGHGQEEEPFGG